MNITLADKALSTRALSVIAPLEVDVVRAIDLTAEHVKAWRDIMAKDAALQSPFYAPDFVQAVGVSNRYVYVAVFRRKGHIEGFLPYQFATVFHRALGIAERAGREMSDYFGLIARPTLHVTPRDLLRLCGLNSLSFTHLDESQQRFGLTGTTPEVGLRIRLAHGSAAYWKQLELDDKRLVSDTDRRERKLTASHGALRFEFTAVDTKSALERLLLAKRLQYSRTSAQDALVERWTTDLITALSGTVETECCGQLSVLFAGDTWIASHFGLRNGHTLHYWFPVYNSDLKAYSPGRLLLKSIINATDAAQITLIDRGSGDTAAKRDFANEEHRYLRDVWYLPGAISLCYRAGLSLIWRIGRRWRNR